MTRNVTDEPRDRFSIYRLCDCPTCGGSGKEPTFPGLKPLPTIKRERCPDCRGEGRIRDEIATCDSPEAIGVALVTLAREGEFEECPIGLLDRQGEEGKRWLIRPWLPSARNVTDAARTLARSKKKATPS